MVSHLEAKMGIVSLVQESGSEHEPAQGDVEQEPIPSMSATTDDPP